MILVTGGAGFIGSHLLDRLSASGEPVRAFMRRSAGKLPAGVETVRGDLAVPTGLDEALRGVTTVFHIAGVTKALHAADYYRGNVRATEQLARAAAGRGIRFIHVSSLAACGPCVGDVAVDETREPAPITHYGKSKLEAERAVRGLVPDAVIVRPPVVYGPRDTGVYAIWKAVSQGVMLQIAGGERWFSMIYVDDLVDGLLAVARAPQAAGRVYFLSHPEPLNWNSLGEQAARLMNRSLRILRVPVPLAYAVGWFAEIWSYMTRKPGIISREKVTEAVCPRWVCDSSRAAAELGFQARTSLAEGLPKTLAWYKEAGWLKF